MGAIVICAPALAGEIGMTRGIARGLQAAGHRVVYVGFPALAPLVAAAGFECIPVFTDWPVRPASASIPNPVHASAGARHHAAPVASLPSPSFPAARRVRSAIAVWRAMRERATRLDAHLASLLESDSNAFLDALREIRPDLVLVSSCVFENMLWTVLSLGAGYRTAYLTNNFDRSATFDVPPVSSSRLASAGVVDRAATWTAWQSILMKREAAGRLRAAAGLSANWRGRIDAFMQRFALARSQLDVRRVMPAFRLPELVPFPRAFDFGPTPATYNYVGPCVDLDPPDVEFDWAALDRLPPRPLIVAAFGNLHHVARRQREQLLRVVTDGACNCPPSATWVVATGDSQLASLRETTTPAHVILAERIPQVRLLPRAAAMITHGGSNSVRECLHFGVPMLVFPRWFDQYGMAARIQAHGLGLVGDPRRVTPSGIVQQVRRLLDEPAYAERAARMRSHAQGYAHPAAAVRLIESWMLASRIMV
jgi:zeaxanthin glucosyltransferase